MHFGPEDDAGVSNPKTTQTTPSHSQAVEAAAKLSDFDRWFGLQSKMHLATPETIAHNAWYASRAAITEREELTSQQEVAAPAELHIQKALDCFKEIIAQDDQHAHTARVGLDAVRAIRAASRVPVASLAEPEGDVQLRACDQTTGREYFIKKGPRSAMQAEADAMNEKGRDYFVIPPLPATREQGVEAVGAVPVTYEAVNRALAVARELGAELCARGMKAALEDFARTAPTSSKTQDDLAGADSGGVQGVEPTLRQLYAMAAMDGYHVGDRDMPSLQRWRDYWDAAMNPSEVLDPKEIAEIGGASQPKAPAPVPVVQGERLTLNNDDFWFLENAASTVEDAGKSGDQDADYSTRQAARLREIKKALFATPANMAVGAVGGVGVVSDWKHWCETCEGVGHYDATLGSDSQLANPAQQCPDCDGKGYWIPRAAPEQATTGSGQVVTDAERYQWLRNIADPDAEDTGIAVSETYLNDWGKFCTRYFAGDELDKAIDAAILSTASPAGEVKP